ncbi:MAG: hypothetical protein PWQ55_2350 [Chloroflexota bacterium]|nr:hypothetical protein [Chloroflexota bacterium]
MLDISLYGKIIDCMFDIRNEPKVLPPKLIPSLVEGFNAVANHIYIIIFPILIDLFFWFGPFVRIKDLVLPTLLNASDLSAPAYGQDSQAFVATAKEMWTTLLSQFNVLYNLRAYPIGIPSLLSYKGVQQNPLGGLPIVELQSSTSAFWLMVGLSLLGLVIGSIYFALIAAVTGADDRKSVLNRIPSQIVQCIMLSVILFIALLFLSIPAICLISSLLVFLPSLGALPLVVFGLALVWVLMPMAFSPHGIFSNQYKATTAIANSIKLVRPLISIVGLFFTVLIMLGYGLDFLWSTPDANSWMLLVGIFGHAFVSSSLIAASFVFYNNGMKWLKVIIPDAKPGQQKTLS